MFLIGIIDVLKAVLFGIVEGISEWLPISSTGHMILLEHWLKVQEEFGASFWDLFLVAIQLGAIIAVIICFFQSYGLFLKPKPKKKKRILGFYGVMS